MSLENQNRSVESNTQPQETTPEQNQKQNLIQTKLLTHKSLMQLGCCLASLGMLSRGIVLAEMVLEIEVYDYEPSYQPAPVDNYSPQTSYSAPSYSPEPYYEPTPSYSPAPYYEPEPYYSQPAPSYYEPEPYYSQPYYEPEPYYSASPSYSEPYYYEPEPEPYYSQPAPSYYEPEPSYYSQPAPSYYEPEPYYSQPTPTYEPEPEPEPDNTIYLPKSLYVAPPTNTNLNLSKKPKNDLPPLTLPKPEKLYYDGSTNAYIDDTNYKVGATDSYEAPSTVVFSERSTGEVAQYPTSNKNWSAVAENNNNWSAPTQTNNWSASTATNNWSAPAQTSSNNSWNGGTQQNYYSQNSYQNSSYDNSYYSSNNSYYSGSSGYSQTSYYSNSSSSQSGYYSSTSYAPYYSNYSQGVEVAAVLPAQVQGLFHNPMSQSGLAYYKRTMRPPAVPGNGNTRLIFPLSIPAPITSLFGWREHPILGYKKFHTGTDLGAPTGTPVVATYAGQVAIADWLGGYGVTVVLDHQRKSLETLYGHLSEIFVKPGEYVQQGEVIGRVGNTGMSTGPHLHFEMRQLTKDGWVAKNPDSHVEFALVNLMTALKVTEIPPVPEVSINELLKQTKELGSGLPQLPPLPPGFEVPIPDLEPPIFELTKASEKSDKDVKISLNEQEKKVVE
uniref:M23 family metallopeptidase n=1 Tax=Okeania sp. SIO2F4 TaxID=2607790 RepID=UPI0025E25204|nr:peptidoglycan DD-metalloendopeptidase family protein [Okeania sp. SIO2F4]